MRNCFKHIITYLFVISLGFSSYSQQSVPYTSYFDSPSDTIGWSHYPLIGNDDWQLGVPVGINFTSAFSSPNAWVTNLNGYFSTSSVMALESPQFDFSNTLSYIIVFKHRYRTVSTTNTGGKIEYSIDNGANWILLDNATVESDNWYNVSNIPLLGNTPAWAGNSSLSYITSKHEVGFLAGNPSVKFRFVFGGNAIGAEGWMIDNFEITIDNTNIAGAEGQPIHVSEYSPTILISTPLLYSNTVHSSDNIRTDYYLSNDSLYDASDIFIGSKISNESATELDYSVTLPLPSGLSPNEYFIVYHHDVLNSVVETDELDNWGYTRLTIENTYDLPLSFDFEDGFQEWKNTGIQDWMYGPGIGHHSEGTHEGNGALYLYNHGMNVQNYIESPYMKFNSSTNLVLYYWYNSMYGGDIEYSINDGITWPDLQIIPSSNFSDWDYDVIDVQFLQTYPNVKFRFSAYRIVIDDIYFGEELSDLSIYGDRKNRFTSSSFLSDTVHFTVINSSNIPTSSSLINFYWSTDTILDAGDLLLGSQNLAAFLSNESRDEFFAFTKPYLTSGIYYLFYQLDVANVINEMNEPNNIGYFTLRQENPEIIPYHNDFETHIHSWRHNATLGEDNWEWTVPNSTLYGTAFSGTKAFITDTSGYATPLSRMHLYTPVYDLTTVTNPVMSFDMKFLDANPSCSCYTSDLNMSYSVDGGANWIILNRNNISHNMWYTRTIYSENVGKDLLNLDNATPYLFDYSESAFVPSNSYNGRDADRSTRYIIDIDFLNSYSSIQFRFNFVTRDDTVNMPGVLLDNFEITDKYVDLALIEKKYLMISSLSNEIKFFTHIKNFGNYISSSSSVNVYLSSDSILDSGDYFLGFDSIPPIRPDLNYYLNAIYPAPTGLQNYQYLIFEIDPLDSNLEINESNNISFWDLALDSISILPYFQDFNDSTVHGWHHYSRNYLGTHITNTFRMRNLRAVNEPIPLSLLESGMYFTDRILSGSSPSHIPYWYLESPNFDLSSYTNIMMSFDLFCMGSFTESGGNMEYSLDGGNTWVLLTDVMGNAQNWYDYPSIDLLFNEIGWQQTSIGPTLLDSTAIDISFLAGESNVVFRFKFRSAASISSTHPKGFRVDNFLIYSYPAANYAANDHWVSINADTSISSIYIPYSFSNNGVETGVFTNTKFYWSIDSIYDASDPMVRNVGQSIVNAGATVNTNTTIFYPTPLTQSIYYLFYLLDANNTLVETNENDNIGTFKIIFNSYNSVNSVTETTLNIYFNGNQIYIQSDHDILEPLSFKLLNMNGKVLYSYNIKINTGISHMEIPPTIANGIYLTELSDQEGNKTVKKIIITR